LELCFYLVVYITRYDTTWKHGITKDLYDAGLRGRLPLFIQGFLQNRQFQVRLGSHISDVFD